MILTDNEHKLLNEYISKIFKELDLIIKEKAIPKVILAPRRTGKIVKLHCPECAIQGKKIVLAHECCNHSGTVTGWLCNECKTYWSRFNPCAGIVG